ncbi:MAG: diguanylate cyclase [Thiomicrorhabdus sp.]|nr:MAG: diguanylate cyclase [Thiomicrorhabdus sp.]
MSLTKAVQIDALTQLCNRVGWQNTAQKSLANAEGSAVADPIALLFIDLDRFKWINDTLGHDAGDALLKKVAGLLKSVLDLQGESPDLVGRYGGDEFVVLLQSPVSLPNLETIANQIVHKLSQPINLDNIVGTEAVEVEIGASVGISCFPQDSNVLDDLLKQADLAMYRAKHSGRNQVVFYQPEMMRQIQRRRQIQMQLRQALKEESINLDYMPKYDCLTQTVVSIEGRLSLKNSQLLSGLDVADLFAIADESQVAITLSEWMIKEALSFNNRLAQLGVEISPVLEVRPSHFQQKDFVEWLTEQLDRCDVLPELVVLSLNEACLNTHRFPVVAQLSALSNLGVEIAVQDFGSASWSLLRLHDWPIDRLHLSARFIQEIGNSSSMEAMTGALISMGNALNKKVAAYGVTTAEQLAFLNSHQCYVVQGLYFSDVLTEAQTEATLLKKTMDNIAQCSAYYDDLSDEGGVECRLDRGEIKKLSVPE